MPLARVTDAPGPGRRCPPAPGAVWWATVPGPRVALPLSAPGRARPGVGRRAVLAAAASLVTGLGVRGVGAAPRCGRLRFIAVYDSHGLTPFGDRLDTLLLGFPTAELQSYTLGGASPSWLIRRPISPRGYAFDSCEGTPLLPRSRLRKQDLQTPSIEALLRVPEGTYERQVVVLTLGSNVPGAPAVLTPPVEQIVRTIGARPDAVCIWVGPPVIRAWSEGYSEQVYAAIREGIRAAEAAKPRRAPACHLVDSRRLSTYPAAGDGIHYGFTPSGTAAAHRWADGVGREIDRVLRGQP